MNNKRVVQFFTDLLAGYEQTPNLLEQKEELITNMTERMRDYMAKGNTFDQAFDAAVSDLGDINEFLAEFAVNMVPTIDSGTIKKKKKKKHKKDYMLLTALAPFLYLFLGFAFNWWAWAWVIIPLTPLCIILIEEREPMMLAAISPFAYVLLGFFFGWWAWAWLIIPVSAIVGAFFDS